MKKLLATAVLLCGAVVSMASLLESYQFNGKGNWSLDAVGSNSSPVGILQAYVPEGSTVEKAFLYSSRVWGYSDVPSVVFDGTTIASSDFTALGITGDLQAFRADVTSQVAAKVGNGSSSRFDFVVNSEYPDEGIDGEILAIVFSNPNETERTIAFLDGFSTMEGDAATFDFAEPMPDPSTDGFEALMSLGIGYSWQQSYGQYSTVDVNGRRLTSLAGGEDDGESENGGLITVGGLDDDQSNPADPYSTMSGYRYDDELYDLTQGNEVNSDPFLSEGTTRFTINTANPSNDDNIFFWGINVTAKGEVFDGDDDIPDQNVPEPATLSLIALSLVSLTFIRKKVK